MGDISLLVQSAADGEQSAWDELVARFSGLVWSVARAHGLGAADAADVSQTTWLRLAERLETIRDPERLGGWLATTARNESLRVLRQTRRSVPFTTPELDEDGVAPDRELLLAERNTMLWQAFDRLPNLCRSLLRVLMSDPAPSYSEVSAALQMPVGSIGPRRARCLQRLRAHVEEAPEGAEREALAR